MVEEKERRLSSWAEFKGEVARIREEYSYPVKPIMKRFELAKDVDPACVEYPVKNIVLFRGQGDACWPIQTTLERRADPRPITDIANYVRLAASCSNEIESFTGRPFGVANHRELEKEIQDNHDEYRPHLPTYSYLVYLRHHGFPSPLLDWSESPYIAAFFAFWEGSKADHVAILAYIECINGCRKLQSPTITVYGPYVTAHQRHFAQKTQYTVATQWDAGDKRHYFCSHEDVFARQDREQDILIKIVLPRTAREEALRELSDYNINPYTLFQTEDALVQTMALKQFDLEAG